MRAFTPGIRLTPAFRAADTDTMLTEAGQTIDDFAGGTQLGAALATLQRVLQ